MSVWYSPQLGRMVHISEYLPVSTEPALTTVLTRTADYCDQCGSDRLLKVKGCVRCERCHYKFDCHGF